MVKGIHFYSPRHFEPWDYRNPDTQGIGGSETSHIEMALRLAERGYPVVSYSPLPQDPPKRFHRGVLWRDLSECTFEDSGVWLLYRCPEAVDKFNPTRTDQKCWLVCQDEDYPQELQECLAGPVALCRQKSIDRVLTLCDAHSAQWRERYPEMADRICQSSNGMKRELAFEVLGEDLPRNPHRIFYPSSPDRGLEAVLTVFERVREFIEDAELWVGYGFDNIDRIVSRIESEPEEKRQSGDVRWIRWVRRLKQKLLTTPGVKVLGRLTQPQLYRYWAQSGLWVYPARFRETSCISSMEAQALGAIPVVNPIWAVAQNVQHGVTIRDELPDTPQTAAQGAMRGIDEPLSLARFTAATVELMLSPQRQDAIRAEMMPWALDHFNWDRFVTQWEGWLQEDMQS